MLLKRKFCATTRMTSNGYNKESVPVHQFFVVCLSVCRRVISALCATDDRGGRLLSEKPSEEAFKALAASNTSGERERERETGRDRPPTCRERQRVSSYVCCSRKTEFGDEVDAHQ
jgi:hypothetical protein